MSAVPIREIAAVLTGLNQQRTVRDFLNALLTPRERSRLALRWRLVCLLAAGLPQRVIARELGISLCKITRGSRELKMSPAFRKIVTDFIQPAGGHRPSKKRKPSRGAGRRPRNPKTWNKKGN